MRPYDEILREQRRLKEFAGVTGTASAMLEAHRASSLAARSESLLSGSLISRAAIGTLGGAIGSRAIGGTIADYLREHGALAMGSIGGFASGAGVGSLSERFSDQIGALRERLGRDMGLVGQVGRLSGLERMLAGDLASAVALRAEMGAAARAASWAKGLQSPSATWSEVLGGAGGLDGQIGRLTRAATDIASIGGVQSAMTRSGALHEAIALKMSAFGGAIDMFGPGAGLDRAVFRSLLGDWRMRPDLPRGFWRDPSARARVYRDAEVDEGLVEAEAADVVEVLVESGVVEGERTSTGMRAVVEVGPLRLAVTTARPRHGAPSR